MAVRTKSPKHAELFLRAVGALGPANGAPRDDDDVSPDDSRFVTHVNILVPHPQLPNGGRMPQLGPRPAVTGMPDLKLHRATRTRRVPAILMIFFVDPHQTLIASLLHKYASGRLREA